MHRTRSDNQLIALLQRDGRMSVSDLARQLGLSRTTVQQRLQRLELSGAIQGYTVVLGDEFTATQIRAHVSVTIEQRESPRVTLALQKIPQVQAIHTISGKVDLIVEVRCASAQDLDTCLHEITSIPGIISSESALIMSTKFTR